MQHPHDSSQRSAVRRKGRIRFAALAVLMASAAPALAQLIDTPSPAVTEFALPNPVAGSCEIEFDRSGKAWVEEIAGNAVSRFDPATKQWTRYPLTQPGATPGGIEIGPDNGIWFPELTTNNITRIDATSGQMTSYPIPFGKLISGPVNAGVAVGTDMATGKDNAIWFSMSGTAALGRIDLATKQIEVITLPIPLSTASTQTQIIQPGPGNLMVVSLAAVNKIATIDVFTREIKQYDVPTPAALPQGVTTDKDGFIWFTETAAQKLGRLDVKTGAIVEYDILALREKLVPVSAGNPLPLPGPVRQGSDGKIYFAEGGFQAGNKIGQFDPTTNKLREFVVQSPAAGICDINNSQPGEIWFGAFTVSHIGRLTIQ